MDANKHRSLEDFKNVRNQLGVILTEMTRIAEERGDTVVDNQSVAAKSSDNQKKFKRALSELLQERADTVLQRDAFRMAIVGKFNAGKSSLLNALLGRDLLVVDFTPKTAAVTILHHTEEEEGYRVTYKAGSPYENRNTDEITFSENLELDLVSITSDDANEVIDGAESIAHYIEQVDVWCNSEFLNKQELEIVDTPGLYSVFIEHGRVTEKIIPTCDAVVFLFPFDPGFGSEEQEFTMFIRNYLNLFLFVMTKSDKADSSHEVEHMAGFSKNVISNIAQIPTNAVYPISSRVALKGNWNGSGLQEFLDALENFLVASTGVERLRTPFEIANRFTERMYLDSEDDIRAHSKSAKQLETERAELEKLSTQISKSRDDLIDHVKNRLEEMQTNATEGLDDLPKLLEKHVEEELETYNKKVLRSIDIKLPSVLQDFVTSWIKRKQNNFQSSISTLQNYVHGELEKIAEDIQSYEASRGRHIMSPTIPDVTAMSAGRSWRLGSSTVMKAGGAFAATFIGSVIAVMTIGIFSPALIFLAPLFPVIRDVANTEERLRNDIKNQLKKNLPGTNYSLFEALVEGYKDETGEEKPGLRGTLTNGFAEWGDQLQIEINDFVDDLVQNRLDQLTRQIERANDEHIDKAKWLKMHNLHKAQLTSIDERLKKLEVFFKIEQEVVEDIIEGELLDD